MIVFLDSICQSRRRVKVQWTHGERLLPEKKHTPWRCGGVLVGGGGGTLCARVVYNDRWIGWFRLHCGMICTPRDVLSCFKTCTGLLTKYISSFHGHSRNSDKWSWQWRFCVCLYHFKLRFCSIDARVLVGCCIMIILVTWNEPWDFVGEGLWSKLSDAPAVKVPFCLLEGQTRLSAWNYLPIEMDKQLSNTHTNITW